MTHGIRVGLLDSTLREGEQTPGVVFTREQRVEIARALSGAGISMIEVGHPAVSPDVYDGVKEIMRLRREGEITSEVVAHSRAVRSDVDIAMGLEVDRIAIWYGVSDIHLAAKTRDTREAALQKIGDAIQYAHDHGFRVRFTPEDASRTDQEYLIQVIRTARECGADRIGVADTVGLLDPEQTSGLFRRLRAAEPGVEYDFHGHNDLGCAVANSLAAISAGATIVHCTVNGLGERVGITPTQVIAVAIKQKFGVDVARLDRLRDLSVLVERYSGIQMPPNYPITGDFAFVHKSGVHVQGILSDPRTYEFMDPSLLNRSRDYVIDKYTGKHAVKARLERMGIPLSDDELTRVISAIKRAEDTRSFSDADLVELVERETGKRVSSSTPDNIEAMVSVKCESNIYTTSVARRLSSIQGVRQVVEVSGEYDIVAWVEGSSTKEINRIIEAMRSVKGLSSTKTDMVLKKLPA